MMKVIRFNLIHYSMREHYEKLKNAKLLIFDFDGVMSDGGIYINNQGDSFRKLDVKDGLGIKLLQSEGIKIAIISGSSSQTIDIRAKSLEINIIRTGIANKLMELKNIQKTLKIKKDETIYLGDDINDLCVKNDVSLFAVPSDAHDACKEKANFISQKLGGKGFIREMADNILISKGKNPFKPFLTRNDYGI